MMGGSRIKAGLLKRGFILNQRLKMAEREGFEPSVPFWSTTA